MTASEETGGNDALLGVHEDDDDAQYEEDDDGVAGLVLKARGGLNNLNNDRRHIRVDNVSIERGQYVPELRLGKTGEKGAKIVGTVRFIYPGEEFAIIESAVEPVTKVLHKLHLYGAFHVDDVLLSKIANAFPLLRSVRIEPDIEQPSPVTSAGLGTFVGALLHLEVLRLPGVCTHVQHVTVSSSILRKLHLTGFVALQTFSLDAPRLAHLRLEADPVAHPTLPGLATTLTSLQELRWLRLAHCIREHEEVKGLHLPKLHSVAISSSTMTADVVMALLLRLSWDGLMSLDLSVLLTDAHLSEIAARGGKGLRSLGLHPMPGSSALPTSISNLVKACQAMTTLHLHDNGAAALALESFSVTEMLVSGAQLAQLRIYCPALRVLYLQECPQLRAANFSLSCDGLEEALLDNTIDSEVSAIIAPLIQNQQNEEGARQEGLRQQRQQQPLVQPSAKKTNIKRTKNT